MSGAICAGLVLACSACASSHDLRDGPGTFGGGIFDETVRPGLHYIVAKTNYAPWKSVSTAQSMWTGKADRACGKDQYRRLFIVDSSAEELPPATVLGVPVAKYITTVERGYALCSSSSLKAEDALAVIKAR